MNSSKDCLNASNSALYSRSTPEPVPASYVQIQNELTPARSPGSCKVRFSDKANKICNPNETNLDETNSDIQSGKTYIGFNSKSSNGLLSGNQVDFMTKANRSMVFYDIVFEWSKFYFWNLDRQSIQEASAGISNVILLNIFIMYTTRRDIFFKFY